jgi:hypothetical protein
MAKNGELWLTKQAEIIQAHGGMILEYDRQFYWFGENKAATTIKTKEGQNVPFVGISCYCSLDLIHWENKGLVLVPNEQLHEQTVVERPRVIFNQATKKFVMWFHYDDYAYAVASCGVAVADQPTGPYRFQKVLRPNGQDSRDFTLYVEAEKAYILYSTDDNHSLCLCELTEDFCDVTERFSTILIDQEREAPVLFNDHGYYFLLSSGTSGWRPNALLYARSTNLMGPYKLIDNPCSGQNYRTTFNGQATAVLQQKGTYYVLVDHWQADNLKNSGYSLLPIQFFGKDQRELTIEWEKESF